MFCTNPKPANSKNKALPGLRSSSSTRARQKGVREIDCIFRAKLGTLRDGISKDATALIQETAMQLSHDQKRESLTSAPGTSDGTYLDKVCWHIRDGCRMHEVD